MTYLTNHNPVINVKDNPYNARGDTVTDDTSAIQAAINAATIGGSTTAFSLTPGSPAVWNSGITIDPTHLDATVGATGFGGSAMIPYSNASITNKSSV